MLTEEQVESIKKQILSQVESWPDDEKKQAAREQIEAMNAEQLEEFLVKNKMIKQTESRESGEQAKSKGQECVFCLIAEGKISSYKIDENKQAVAVLEINPLARGHALVVPRKHITTDKISTSSLSLAKKIAKELKTKLKARDVEISTSNVSGHAIVNIIPFYGEKPKERKKASEQELKELQGKLAKKQREKIERKEKKPEKLPQAPRRVP